MFTGDIKKIFPKVKTNIKTGDITTFGIGGEIAYFLFVESAREISDTIEKIKENDIPYNIIAGGSNIIFPDGRIEKLIIKIGNSDMEFEDASVHCGAGTELSSLVRESARLGLAGLESLTKIPGTVGGAICGNAGAYGQSISDCLSGARIFNGTDFIEINKPECKFEYRSSVFKEKEWIIISADFDLREGDKAKIQKKRKEIIKVRSYKYKKGIKCPGSYFKNIIADELPKEALTQLDREKIIHGKVPAGYLLEEVGACGMTYGGLEVASYHGNLIINNGEATFKDIMELSDILKDKVRQKFGIELEEEVVILR